MTDRIPLVVEADDPVSRSGVVSELRTFPDVRVLPAEERARLRWRWSSPTTSTPAPRRWCRRSGARGRPAWSSWSRDSTTPACSRRPRPACPDWCDGATPTETAWRPRYPAARGEGTVPADLLARLLDQVGRLQRNGGTNATLLAGFTEREIEVLKLVAEGCDTAEIVYRLAYSQRTIKNIVHDVTTRFNLRNRSTRSPTRCAPASSRSRALPATCARPVGEHDRPLTRGPVCDARWQAEAQSRFLPCTREGSAMAVIEGFEDVSAEEILEELRNREARVRGEAQSGRPRGVLASAESSTLTSALREKQKVIYGVDDRVDLFRVTDAAAIADSDAVVALFQTAQVVDNGDGTSRLVTQQFGTSRNLCASEPFADQPVGAFCSGFLVEPDVVATAGHCVRAPQLDQVRFVFGFRMQDATTPTTTVPNRGSTGASP